MCALWLTACADQPHVVQLPPAERFAQVAVPLPPVGEASCEGAPCLSEREAGELMADAFTALREANRRLLWLATWRAEQAGE